MIYRLQKAIPSRQKASLQRRADFYTKTPDTCAKRQAISLQNTHIPSPDA